MQCSPESGMARPRSRVNVPPIRAVPPDWEEADMAKGSVLDPTTARADDVTSPGPDAGPLAGKVIGIRVDQMWRSWDWISELWAEEFKKAGAAGVKFWRSCGHPLALFTRTAARA